jgi:hypothetical protein
MKRRKLVRIARHEVKSIINKIPFTAFFGVVFRKVDGSIRKMNCNRSISTGLKNQRSQYVVFTDSILVYDINVKKEDGSKGGFRKVNLEKVGEINANGIKYLVV